MSRVDMLEDRLPATVADHVADRVVDRLATELPQRAVLVLAGDLGSDPIRLLEELRDIDSGAAERLAAVLANGGIQALAALIRRPQASADEMPAVFWQYARRISLASSQLSAARHAFEREADHPGVDDRPGALISTARVALAAGDNEGAARLADDARELEPEHPAVVLYNAAGEGSAADQLRLVEQAQPRSDRQRAWQQSLRALALLALGRHTDAVAAARESIRLDEHGAGREAEGSRPRGSCFRKPS